METLKAQVVKSLDGVSDELHPYLPYLLQDLWELGSSPEPIIRMVRDRIDRDADVLDLGCGKGAVSVRLAAEIGCRVRGIDGMEAFIDFARRKAHECGVGDLCRFDVGDIRKSVDEERGYDLVIMGAPIDALGDLGTAVTGLKKAVGSSGLILIDDAFCEDGKARDGCLTRREVLEIFADNGVELVREEVAGRESQEAGNARNNACIARRAVELKKAFPDRAGLFDRYLRKQLDECSILENDVICATWLLKKTG